MVFPTLSDFDDGALDLHSLSELVNSPEPTFVTRLGDERPTLVGTLAIYAADNVLSQAQAAKAGAESAQAAALIQAGVAVDEPTGRASVANGQAFKYQGAGRVAAYEGRRIDSSTSELIAAYVGVPYKDISTNSTRILGRYLNGSGAETTATNWSYTRSYLPVEPGALVFFSGSTTNAVASVVFYDASKAFLSAAVLGSSGSAVVVTDRRIAVPAGAAFARVSGLRAEAYKLKTNDFSYTEKADVTAANATLSVNLFDPSRATDNAILTTNTQTLHTGYFISDYIRVTPGTTFVTNGAATSGATTHGVHCYDASKAFLSTIAEQAAGVGFVIPFDVEYIRVNFTKASSQPLSQTMVCVGSLPDHFVRNVNAPTASSGGSHWFEKGWGAFGDSITDSKATPTTYPPKVALRLGATLFDYAKSGSRTRDSFIYCTSAAGLANVDVVTIAHGTNDFKLETPLGALADPAVLGTTFYGDYKAVIEQMYAWKPSLRIGLATPIRRTQAPGAGPNSLGHYLSDYRDAIVAIGNYYALPVLDLYNRSGFNSVTIATLTSDGLHPLEAAQTNVMVPSFAGFLESI